MRITVLSNAVALQAGLADRPINWLGEPWLAMTLHGRGLRVEDQFLHGAHHPGRVEAIRPNDEAGRMDGMSRWQEFREITLPLLRAPILAALVIRTMDALEPSSCRSIRRTAARLTATESLSLYAYKVIFQLSHFNFGAAVVVWNSSSSSSLMSLVYIFALRGRD